MFKLFTLLVLGFIACSWALPINEDERKIEHVPIISSETVKDANGGYDTHYESGDGSTRGETAEVKVDEDGVSYLEVKGFYTYLNEFGETVRVDYKAGRDGYVPTGSIINPEISQVAEAAKDLPKFEPEQLVSKTATV